MRHLCIAIATSGNGEKPSDLPVLQVPAPRSCDALVEGAVDCVHNLACGYVDEK